MSGLESDTPAVPGSRSLRSAFVPSARLPRTFQSNIIYWRLANKGIARGCSVHLSIRVDNRHDDVFRCRHRGRLAHINRAPSYPFARRLACAGGAVGRLLARRPSSFCLADLSLLASSAAPTPRTLIYQPNGTSRRAPPGGFGVSAMAVFCWPPCLPSMPVEPFGRGRAAVTRSPFTRLAGDLRPPPPGACSASARVSRQSTGARLGGSRGILYMDRSSHLRQRTVAPSWQRERRLSCPRCCPLLLNPTHLISLP